MRTEYAESAHRKIQYELYYYPEKKYHLNITCRDDDVNFTAEMGSLAERADGREMYRHRGNRPCKILKGRICLKQ